LGLQIVRAFRVKRCGFRLCRQRGFAICSLPFEQARPAKIATGLRQHWGIENSLHWVRRVTYDGDRSTTHIGNGAQIMASCATPRSTGTASTAPPR
jgi:hypothetical protein